MTKRRFTLIIKGNDKETHFYGYKKIKYKYNKKTGVIKANLINCDNTKEFIEYTNVTSVRKKLYFI